MRVSSRWAWPILALSLAGCEKSEKTEDRSSEPAASVEQKPALDPALAKAMAQASAAAPKRPKAAAGGPPESGVFEPGAADREALRGAAPKITLGERGSEPRVTIGPLQPKPGFKVSGSVQVALQTDPRMGALPVQLELTLDAQKAKPEAGAEAGAAGGSPVTVTARVTGAGIPAAGVPAEISSRIAQLKGARVTYRVAPDGSGTDYRFELAGAAQDTLDYLRVLSDTLALVTLPTPDVPLGQGGFWMTTSREGVFGLDLVTYRMVKVEKIQDKVVTLSVSTRRYSATDRFEFAGLPADVPRELLEFDAKSDGTVEVMLGESFPTSGDIGSLLSARLGTPEKSGLLQIQSRVALKFAPK